MSIGLSFRTVHSMVGSCLVLYGSLGRAVEEPALVPPLPGDFLEAIPAEEYIRFEQPIPAGSVFDIRDFGAIGDGKTVNTGAINGAVQAAHAKGGGVVLIQGGDFVSGTVKLASNMTLHIARDGILRASRDSADYAPFHLLLCEKADHVVIEGPGRILGDGEAWWKPPRMEPLLAPPETFMLQEALSAHFASKRARLPHRPSPFIRLSDSSDLTVRNLIIENSPGWTLVIDHSDRVQVKDVVISNNYHGGNTDGIDVVGSRDVEITHCFVATGDDGIVLKNGFVRGKSRAMTNIRVSDCAVMSSANCFKIGTETWSDISDVSVSDCTFFVEGVWPWALAGIAIESVDGAKVNRVNVQNITMRNVMTPIFIRLGNRNRWKSKEMQGALENVSIRKVKATGAEFPCTLSGIPDLYIKEVTLDDIDIAYREAPEQLEIQNPIPEQEDQYPEFAMFGDLPAYGLWARHIDGLTVTNFRVHARRGNTRKMFVLDDVLNSHVPVAKE